MENEIWLPIKDYEGIYELSNFGRCRSLDRYIKHSSGHQRKWKGKIIKPIYTHGYLSYHLAKNGGYFKTSTHRLLATHFISNPNSKPQVNHIDGNKQNNNLSNLEWVTAKENIIHAHKEKLISHKGIKGSAAKLTESQVLEIRKTYVRKNKKASQKILHQKYGVSIGCINQIITRRTWNHI